MGKKDKTPKPDKVERKLAKLEAIIADKSRPKAERKAAKAQRAEIIGATLTPVPEPDEPAPPVADGDPATPTDDPTPEQVIAAADRVLADKGASEGAVESAKAARKRAERALKIAKAKAVEAPADAAPEVDDAALARRVKAKRSLRKAGLLSEGPNGEAVVDPDAVPRDDAELVAAYNEVIGRATGHYLTSDDERAAIAERIAPKSEPVGKAELVAALEQVIEAEPETIAEHEAVEVETETGTVYAVGPAVESSEGDAPAAEPAFASPSEAPPTLETNGLGQYKIKRPSDGKLVGYTRVTTYIDNLEDKSNLDKWRRRIMLEGLVANETAVGTSSDDEPVPPHLLAEARDAIHAREVAIAKARKADRKGKLVPGELGDLVDAANKACRDKLNALGEQALDLGGVKTAADKGTDLHALTEVYDEHGIEPIAAMLDEGKITPADFADLEAYGAAMRRAGIKVIARELVVVDDERKVAGRLDKIVLAKASPEAKRATRMVADVKTGSVEWSPGKIAQQLELYAGAKAYDLETHERSDHGASRTTALLIHLPAGKATCHVYAVDLVTGRVGNRLSGEVRAWRTSSRKAVDFAVDLAALPEGGES